MKIEEIDELNKNIKVAIPLTGQTSKTRVKSRDICGENNDKGVE